ncbi:MAG: restriction endonuclease subunit S [Lentisphaerota bacterium]
MSEWKEYKVSEFSQILSGTTPSSSIEEYWDGDIRWITPVDLSKTTSRFIDNSERKITKKGLENSSRRMIPAYSVVMSSRAPIGYFAISTQEYTTNQGCKSFVLKNGQDKDFHYFNFLLNKNKFLNLGSGSTFQEISKTSIHKLTFIFPTTFAEQRAIASVLTNIDEAIEATEKIIAKRRLVKEGLMQDLFRYGLDDKGQLRSEKTHRFKDSFLGRIPEEWDVVEFGNRKYFTLVTDGSHYSPKPVENSEFLIATVENMRVRNFDLRTCKFISKKDYQSLTLNNCKPENYDILFSKDGTIGQVFVYMQDSVKLVLLSSICIIRPSQDKVNSHFVANFLKSFHLAKQLISLTSGSALKRVVLRDINKIKILKPSINEQNKIAAVLLAIDTTIEKDEAVLEKLKAQKRGLMEDLLSGKVQVPSDMIAKYDKTN